MIEILERFKKYSRPHNARNEPHKPTVHIKGTRGDASRSDTDTRGSKFFNNVLIKFFQLPAYLYRWGLSPLLHTLCGPASGCRFEPSCSQYWIESIEQHGIFRGSFLGLRRILRCHPGTEGGFDPVPKKIDSSNACSKRATKCLE